MNEITKISTNEWTVRGMDCASCAAKIRGVVERLPGVSDVSVAVVTERLRLLLDERTTTRETVEETVRKLGYSVSPRASGQDQKRRHDPEPNSATDVRAGGRQGAHSPESQSPSPAPTGSAQHDDTNETHEESWFRTQKGRIVIVTGALVVLAWAFELFTSSELGRWAFTLACLLGLAPVARRAFAALRVGQPFTIESLMAIAAIGALHQRRRRSSSRCLPLRCW